MNGRLTGRRLGWTTHSGQCGPVPPTRGPTASSGFQPEAAERGEARRQHRQGSVAGRWDVVRGGRAVGPGPRPVLGNDRDSLGEPAGDGQVGRPGTGDLRGGVTGTRAGAGAGTEAVRRR
ncbi:hypothetical protein OHT61_27140 [Streptomyces sp. NBC_00178]|uniref:hypothetical protein n=1 Tax=Streptomyces sp. NBC_00178 TaxID=2975672 RepID=UPI002E2ABFB5|nr:hypothetical protein [Streptomyces sp. NBC_00178]